MSRSCKGKVSISEQRGWLRLRWTFQKQRYEMSLHLPDTETSRALAQQRATIIEADMLSGQFDETLAKYKEVSQPGVSVVELFEKFIVFKRREVPDPRTLEKYEGLLNHLRQYFRNRQVKTLTEATCFEFRDWLLDRLAPRTASERLSMMRACWRWGCDRGFAQANPWLSVKVKVPPKQRPKPFSSNEVKLILQGFKDHRHYSYYFDFVFFLLSTGCRTGEAIGLQWKHLSEKCDRVWIGESYSRGKRKATKTNKSREFVLTAGLRKRLQTTKAELNPDPEDLVFPSRRGGPIDDHNFRNRAWKSILKKVGVEYRKPYNTRHTFVSHAIDEGLPPVEIAELTGHNEETLFKHYLGKTGREAQLPPLWDDGDEDENDLKAS
jgi:integrase